jgi:hypothetical protein
MYHLTAEEQFREDFDLSVELLERFLYATKGARNYSNCEWYREIVLMGEHALPLIREEYVKGKRLLTTVWESLITDITGIKLKFPDDIPQITPPDRVQSVCRLNSGAENRTVDVSKVRTERDIRVGYVSLVDRVLGEETVPKYMQRGQL